ncbi:MAG: Coq4 family protein [Parvularculaceae bacterium]
MSVTTAEFSAAEERLDRFPASVKPFSAAIALLKFLHDKEDTAQVFRIFDYLDGPQSEKNFQRFATTPGGQRMMRENADLAPLLSEKTWLRRLPAETLGGQYIRFMDAENIGAEGLIDYEKKANARSLRLEPGRRIFISTGYQLHDVWHVLVGYGRDLVGEATVLAFTYGQLQIKGINLLCRTLGIKETLLNLGVPVWAILDEGEKLGREAEWLLPQDWKKLLETPLDDVRRTLNVGAPSLYLKHAAFLQKDDVRRRAKMGYASMMG